MYAILLCIALLACFVSAELGDEPICLAEHIKPSKDYDPFKEDTELAWIRMNFGVNKNPKNLSFCYERYEVFQEMIKMECNVEYTALLCESYFRVAKDCQFRLYYGGKNSTTYGRVVWYDYHNSKSMDFCPEQFSSELTYVYLGLWIIYGWVALIFYALIMIVGMEASKPKRELFDMFFSVNCFFLVIIFLDTYFVTYQFQQVLSFVWVAFFVTCLSNHLYLQRLKKFAAIEASKSAAPTMVQVAEIPEQTKTPVDVLPSVESSNV